jgi:hypothetical protein
VPEQALARAVAQPEAVTGDLLALLERAADGMVKSDEEANQLFNGLHVLGAIREAQAFAPLMRLLRRPPDDLDWLLGDGVTEALPRIVAGVFDRTPDALFQMLADRDVDPIVRMGLFGTLAFLTWDGRIDKDETIRFLVRFHEERLAPDDDEAWVGWQDAIALLGLRDLAGRVEAAWRDERMPPGLAEPEFFWEMLEQAEAAPSDRERFSKERLGYIEDIVADLAWIDAKAPDMTDEERAAWEAEWEQALDVFPLPEPPIDPVHNPMRHVGRNDPCPCGSGKKAKKCCLRH